MARATRSGCSTALARAGGAALVALVLGAAGCVERRIRVTSEPAGALVWLNDVEIGRTPTETNFKYYGKYDVRLEMPGYETVEAVGDASSPWWEAPGPDLIAEAIPGAKSTITWHYVLTPALAGTMPKEQLEREMIERAHELREKLGPAPEATTPSEDAGGEGDGADGSSVGVPVLGGEADDGAESPDAVDDEGRAPDR